MLRDECGIFVSKTVAGSGPAGRSANPFKTIDEAVKEATKRTARVYVCADGDYKERLDIPAGISVFGGIDCAGGTWTYGGATKSRINPDAPGTADDLQASVRVSGDGTSTLEDLDIVAANATLPGGSAIAAIMATATVNVERCILTAGRGGDGAPGESLGIDDNLNGKDGTPGVKACSGDVIAGNLGGAEVTLMCDGIATTGGAGGLGGPIESPPPTPAAAGNGANGGPAGGAGGTGESKDGLLACTGGMSGADGAEGGAGTSAEAVGTIGTDGYTPALATAGKTGGIGQGGGGGGGARGGTNICAIGMSGAGASGGSGGSGGCGGKGGGAGGSGGASIALLSLNAQVSLNDSELVAGRGGDGGKGGDGQAGGGGGLRGAAGQKAGNSKVSCQGGPGGSGGKGGPGGGGAGGPSIVIAVVGTTPTKRGTTQYTLGETSLGGAGGEGMSVIAGPDGTAEEAIVF
ncbi:PGRS family protein [Polyangium sp. 15x6]|uniref:PGRS family protein n=1 Tax=Polyangium sp. 15x6 TaxID=3042687 RepID=UPI00249AE920|nr:PGRS family protein [Polyangium sp. 15x6]MDI3285362.1 PGRS family protein [Polyangium sp. 15x6]